MVRTWNWGSRTKDGTTEGLCTGEEWQREGDVLLSEVSGEERAVLIFTLRFYQEGATCALANLIAGEIDLGK